jgi:MFS family permease
VVCAGLATKDLADRIGSKPLVFISGVASLFCLFLWAVFPVNVDPLWYYFLGFVTNFFLSSVNLLVVRLIAQVMPDDDAVPFNAMVNFVIALFALAAGFLSGLMANFSSLRRTYSYWVARARGTPTRWSFCSPW